MRVLVAAAGAAVAVAGVALVTAAAATAAPRTDTSRTDTSRADTPRTDVAGSAAVGAAPGSWNVHVAGVAMPLTVTAAGQTVTFAYTITNASAGPVSDPSVTGTLNGTVVTVACPAGVLAPGAGVTCTGAYRVRAADLGAGSLTLDAAIGATSADGRPLGSAAVPAAVVVAHAGSARAAAPLVTPADTVPTADTVTTEAQAAPAGAAQRRLAAAPSVTPSGSATTWSSGPVAYTGPPDTGVTVAAGLALLVIGGLLLTLARPRTAGARSLRRSRVGHHAGSTVAQWRR